MSAKGKIPSVDIQDGQVQSKVSMFCNRWYSEAKFRHI